MSSDTRAQQAQRIRAEVIMKNPMKYSDEERRWAQEILASLPAEPEKS